MNQRHTEWFGPDFARGPFGANYLETSAVQIATALAQLRTPISRSDEDIRDHADFIRQLADRIAPEYAAFIHVGVNPEQNNSISTSIRLSSAGFYLLDCWLADTPGGGLTSNAPLSVSCNAGTILETITSNRRYLIITNATGVADLTVNHNGTYTWFWSISRNGRIIFSNPVEFS